VEAVITSCTQDLLHGYIEMSDGVGKHECRPLIHDHVWACSLGETRMLDGWYASPFSCIQCAIWVCAHSMVEGDQTLLMSDKRTGEMEGSRSSSEILAELARWWRDEHPAWVHMARAAREISARCRESGEK